MMPNLAIRFDPLSRVDDSKIQDALEPGPVETNHHFTAGIQLDERGGSRVRASRHDLLHPLGVHTDVPLLEPDPVLGKPRFLRVTGPSPRLAVQDHPAQHRSPPQSLLGATIALQLYK